MISDIFDVSMAPASFTLAPLTGGVLLLSQAGEMVGQDGETGAKAGWK